MSDLRLGRWQDVLADVDGCDMILSDPPFSPRTHKGYLNGNGQEGIDEYQALTKDLVSEFVDAWHQRVRHWVVLFGDHITYEWWAAAWRAVGWYVFAPVIWVKSGAPPRMCGDGPKPSTERLVVACSEGHLLEAIAKAVSILPEELVALLVNPSTDHIMVARPRKRVRDHASREGHYHAKVVRKAPIRGVKDPIALTKIVYDYTRPGDLVCDPYAGTATVGEACYRMGRRYVGSEMDRATWEHGVKRLNATPRCPRDQAPDRWAEVA